MDAIQNEKNPKKRKILPCFVAIKDKEDILWLRTHEGTHDMPESAQILFMPKRPLCDEVRDVDPDLFSILGSQRRRA